MLDATILIPTHGHAALVPYAIRSALEQEGVSFEVMVVGDGVEDDTRAALEPFASEQQVRFFDFPKRQRHGERSRHEALQEAQGKIVCYLSDDDLLLPDHVAEMARLLEGADLAHSAPVEVLPGGALRYRPFDLARPAFQAMLLRGGWNAVSLSGAAHTMDAYRRLPHGWRPAPPGVWSDLYMWQQFVRLEGFRGLTAVRLTHLHLADQDRASLTEAERVAELEQWWLRSREPGFAAALERELAELAREGAVARELRIHQLKSILGEIQSTRWWRLRTRLAISPPVSRLLARRRRAALRRQDAG